MQITFRKVDFGWNATGHQGTYGVDLLKGLDNKFACYYKLKFGTELSLKFAPKSRTYFGRVAALDSETITLEKVTAKEIGKEYDRLRGQGIELAEHGIAVATQEGNCSQQ